MSVEEGIKELVIDYSPHLGQQRVHDCPKRFRVLVCGRRWGKTTLAVNEIIKVALTVNNSRIFYIAPTYKQSKMIAFNLIKKYLPQELLEKINQVDLTFYLKNGSEISLKGADSEDTLRGVGLDFVVLDEYATMKANVWQEIIRPMLSDTRGRALFIGTPKGRNHLFDIFTMENEEYQSFHFVTTDNPYIPSEEIEQAKKDMSERLFKQEFMAEFLDDETSVFKGIRNCGVGALLNPVLGRHYVMGADLAKSQDFTVLTVIDATTRSVVAFERFQDIRWTEQKLRIQSLSNKYNNALVYLDATGVGDPIFEDLQTAGVSVEGYKFTNESKQRLIEQLAIAIEQRMITFPNIEAIMQELMQFEYSITQNGRIIYSAPDGKHDDCVISLGLAVWGIRSYINSAQSTDRREATGEEEYRDRQGRGERVGAQQESPYINIVSGY